MFASAKSHRHTYAAGAAFLLLACGLSVAEEKANITPPSGTKKPVDAAPLKDPSLFQPLDRDSSLGAVIDSGTPLPPTPVTPLSPRQQREMLERLDRQRNFLMIDPADNASQSGSWLADDEGAPDNRLNARRHQSLLERRLTGSAQAAAKELAQEEAPSNEVEPEGLFNDEFSNKRAGSTTIPGLTLGEKSPASGLGFANFSVPDTGETLSAPATLEDLRSALAIEGGRGLGLDALTKERLERYKMTAGEGATIRRGFDLEANEFGQTRSLRSDSMEQLMSPTPIAPKPSASLESLMAPEQPEPGAISRSPLKDPAALGIIQNVYTPAPAAAQPPPAPALRFLKEARPEPPRTRL